MLARDYWGVPREQAPLTAVLDKNWKYIRRAGEANEELFYLSEDTKEQRNLVRDPSAQATLEQMRAAMDRLTGEPLLPERFSR